ncbi:CDP-glucose 4,6-dehydratase [Bdellovibrio sp. qaytius]|nr:CDP-glucose 4,6-dehydratase [Bdellovibrio sp. qaytius]
MAKVVSSFWKGKKVLVTGHTGFKGSWMSLWLQQMGAEVCGYALKPPTEPALYDMAQVGNGMKSVIADIADYDKVLQTVKDFKPEIVFHMAAQPLVRYSYEAPVETYRTNVMGTVNILDACLKVEGIKAVINVTTDKCYENYEWIWGYKETDRLGGSDPYSNSKGCSEMVTQSYRKSFYEKKKIPIASARAGNVIGGGDWARDRLLPDLMMSIISKKKLVIRNPKSTRPWQHVLEPLSGYLVLAQKMYETQSLELDSFNFGPHDDEAQNVEYIVKQLLSKWDDNAGYEVIPSDIIEATYLKLDCSKAKSVLNWKSKLTINQCLDMIIDWNKKAQANPASVREVTISQIQAYTQLMN